MMIHPNEVHQSQFGSRLIGEKGRKVAVNLHWWMMVHLRQKITIKKAFFKLMSDCGRNLNDE